MLAISALSFLSFTRLNQLLFYFRQNQQWFVIVKIGISFRWFCKEPAPRVQNLRNIQDLSSSVSPLWNRLIIWSGFVFPAILWLHQPPRSTNSPYQVTSKVMGSFKSCAKARITLCVNLSIVKYQKQHSYEYADDLFGLVLIWIISAVSIAKSSIKSSAFEWVRL
jgi:hypothetical protein